MPRNVICIRLIQWITVNPWIAVIPWIAEGIVIQWIRRTQKRF